MTHILHFLAHFNFRRAFHEMSTSPEAFHVLRCACASTHALISICQYLLGIGDRHLSNFMINMATGQMIGIDFGHAFGSATQVAYNQLIIIIIETTCIFHFFYPINIK